jgi:hypothetical protein
MSLSTVLVGEFGPMMVIAVSRAEIGRMSVLRDLAASRIKVTEAATRMGLGRRQVFRLAKAYARRRHQLRMKDRTAGRMPRDVGMPGPGPVTSFLFLRYRLQSFKVGAEDPNQHGMIFVI